MDDPSVVAIGNIYLETNYLGVETAGQNVLSDGKEYRAASYEMRLAGSPANFAYQLTKLGEQVSLVGKVGPDPNGPKLVDLLTSNGIDTSLIVRSRDPGILTSIDTGLVFAHSGSNIQVVAGNANQSLSIEDIDLDNPVFAKAELVYVSGFMKQDALWRDYPVLLSALRERKIPVFLDHGRIPVDISEEKRFVLLSILPYVTGYMPNLDELLSVSRADNTESAVDWAMNQGIEILALKMGPQGCIVKSKDREYQVAGYDVRAVNTVGAGDVFNAAFVYQYLNDSDLEDCALFANAAAAHKVSTNLHPDAKTVHEFVKDRQI